MWQDIRYALRGLRRNPGFAAVAVLSLALGIGVNTAIFSLIDAILLRMLPVRDPGQLVEFLHSIATEPQHRGNGFSPEHFDRIRDGNHVFSGVLGAARARLHVGGAALEPQIAEGQYVTGNFFSLLGVTPTRGRLLVPGDDKPGAPPVAVVSWAFWKTRPTILGQTITVEDKPVTVVGVAPSEFFGLLVGTTDAIWLPLALRPAPTQVALVARLKPGVTPTQALAEMKLLDQRTPDEQARVMRENPLGRDVRLDIEPAGAGLSVVRDRYQKPLFVLMILVAMLLIIACGNLAGMLLARSAGRRKEMALRIALGASRVRLMRQSLTESILLSAAGGVLGFLLAWWAATALARLLALRREHLVLPVHLDSRVLFFTAGAVLVTALLCGLVPALYAISSSPASALSGAGKETETRSRRLLGRSLVAAQVALSVVILSAAVLFVRQLSELKSVDLGFRRDHVLLVKVDPPHAAGNPQHLATADQQILQRLEAIPGVRSATLSAVTPLSGAGASRNANVEGYQPRYGEVRLIQENWVAPHYFETYGTPLLAGRDFTESDNGPARVAIINQLMARYYFGSASPLGRHVTFDGDDRPYEIIGVVGDTKYVEIQETTWRTIYFDAFQGGEDSSDNFALRTGGDPASLAPQARRVIEDVLPAAAISRVTTLAAQVDDSLVEERLVAALAGALGGIGALLAALGLFALLSYTVARRTNEIGIRLALGSTPREIVRMVIRDALITVAAALALGCPIAWWTHTLAQRIMPELKGSAILPIAVAAFGMLSAALLAAYVPAGRAARVNPSDSIRAE